MSKLKKILKWGGIGVGALVAVALLGVGVAFGLSVSRQGERFEVTVQPIELPSDPESLAEGERLYVSRGCPDCHLADGTGKAIIDDPAIGTIVGANLTRTRDWPVEDHLRAIRHGIGQDGRPLVMMPSHEYYSLSDLHVGRIIAHYTRLPPATRQQQPISIGPVARVLHVAGLFPLLPAELIDHDAPRPRSPEPAVTREYGAYLGIGCTGCHGEHLSGGPIPGAPPELGVPRNLTPHESGLAAWTRDDFVAAMRTGHTPDGRQLNPEQMPWRNMGRMDDTELHALWLYLESVPPREEGTR